MHTKNKPPLKIICVLFSFLLIFSSIITDALSGMMQDIKTVLKNTYALVTEEENSIQFACVGNSNLYSGFSPYDLWNEYG